MPPAVLIRPIESTDLAAWEPLWVGYNAFYGRKDATALSPAITHTLWTRFLDPNEAVFGLVAEQAGHLVGLAHFLFHPSTIRIEPVCYLQDLFTDPATRGHGIGRALIEGVHERARSVGVKRVYWQTQASNAPARLLYDKIATHAGFIVYGAEV